MSRKFGMKGVASFLGALACGIGILHVPVAAAAQEAAKILAGAESEGKVVVYGAPGPQYRKALVDSFQKSYPKIRVEYFGGAGRDEATKILQEQSAGLHNADVYISGTTNGVVTLKGAKAVEPLPPALYLPEVVNKRAWLEGDFQWADAREPLTTLMFECGISQMIHVNPKLADPKQFTSYWDMLDSKWKGKIVGTDVRQPGPGGVPSRFIFKHAKLGPDYLTRLFRDTEMTLSSDQRQLTDWIAMGKFPVGIFVSDAAVKLAQDQKLPIVAIPVEQLKEGGPIGPGYGAVSLVAKAPHPQAARLYINWVLSKEGQIAWQTNSGKPSCRVDIPRQGVDEVNIPKPGFKYVMAGTEEYSRLTGSVIGNVINKALEARETKR